MCFATLGKGQYKKHVKIKDHIHIYIIPGEY